MEKKSSPNMRSDWKIIVVPLMLILLSCGINKKDIIATLDMIPLCDHLQFPFIHKGMTEDVVINLYGRPRLEYYFDSTGALKLKDNVTGKEGEVQKDPATKKYKIQIESYDESPYPISYKIIVYWGSWDAIAYVYIDHKGKVERTFVGGS
ncbi:MAG TPA: hypothetical protein VF399_09170 [bacterium]